MDNNTLLRFWQHEYQVIRIGCSAAHRSQQITELILKIFIPFDIRKFIYPVKFI